MPTKKAATLRMQQIISCQWTSYNRSGEPNPSFSIVALGLDGNVYRYNAASQSWLPYRMVIGVRDNEGNP